MAGSVAEERIRVKAEAMLRDRYPDARIVHELVLEQGGCRIDVAAILAQGIIAVEIKSERDVLDRLAAQIGAAVKVSRTVMVCTTEKHADKIVALGSYYVAGGASNPDHIPALRHCTVMAEQQDGMLGSVWTGGWSDPTRILGAEDLLKMLWAPELRRVCYDLGVGQKATRSLCIWQACELLSGQEVRRRVCRELRSRPFPRADPAIDTPRDAPPPETDTQKAML